MNSVTPIWPAVFLGMYLFLELLDLSLIHISEPTRH